jgi:hypothetical protein
MGKKKLPPDEKKTSADSSKDHREKLKEDLGEDVFLAGEAERMRRQRQLDKERLEQNEKERRREQTRVRVARCRAKKRGVKLAAARGLPPPGQEPEAELVVHPAEPVVHLVAEPLVDPVAEPVVDPVAEPVVDPVAEPVVDPVAEPVVDPVAKKDKGKEKKKKAAPVLKTPSGRPTGSSRLKVALFPARGTPRPRYQQLSLSSSDDEQPGVSLMKMLYLIPDK